tara:strand:- start:33 stop:263 length:231 start_codon:yes stop_codon:yes gene_type:complete
MAVYKGKYIKQSDDTYTVELYTDDTVSETITEIPKESDAKSIILVWYAQQGYTRPDITDQNFIEDWDNFDSLYVKS